MSDTPSIEDPPARHLVTQAWAELRASGLTSRACKARADTSAGNGGGERAEQIDPDADANLPGDGACRETELDPQASEEARCKELVREAPGDVIVLDDSDECARENVQPVQDVDDDVDVVAVHAAAIPRSIESLRTDMHATGELPRGRIVRFPDLLAPRPDPPSSETAAAFSACPGQQARGRAFEGLGDVWNLDDPAVEEIIKKRSEAARTAVAANAEVVALSDGDCEGHLVNGQSRTRPGGVGAAFGNVEGLFEARTVAVRRGEDGYDQQTIRKLVEVNNLSADATEEVDDPPELTVALMRHQRRAVAWMLKRERVGTRSMVAMRSSAVGIAGSSFANLRAAAAGLDQFQENDDEDSDDLDDDFSSGADGELGDNSHGGGEGRRRSGVVRSRGVVRDNVGENVQETVAERKRPHTAATKKSEFCRGGILADEQGLGKTLSVISLLLSNRPPGVAGKSSSSCAKWRTLIVCPVSLVEQWKDEIESRVESKSRPSIYVYHGTKRTKDPDILADYDVVISTYATVMYEYPKVLKSDPRYAAAKKAKQRVPRRIGGPLYHCNWFRVVLDEAHNIKNRQTDSWKAACMLPAERRWCLTGTPIQNNVDDIYSLFRFIRYGFMVKNNYRAWNDTWKKKLESPNNFIRERAFKRFQTIVGVVTLRRTKRDTIDGKALIALPERLCEVREVRFNDPRELEVYQAIEQSSRQELRRLSGIGSLGQHYSGIMLLLLRMRQACCHPYLIEYTAQKATASGSEPDFFSPYSLAVLDAALHRARTGLSALGVFSEHARMRANQLLQPPVDVDVALGVGKELYECSACGTESLAVKCRMDRFDGRFFCAACVQAVQQVYGNLNRYVALELVCQEVHANAREDRRRTQASLTRFVQGVANSSKRSSVAAEKLGPETDDGESFLFTTGERAGKSGDTLREQGGTTPVVKERTDEDRNENMDDEDLVVPVTRPQKRSKSEATQHARLEETTASPLQAGIGVVGRISNTSTKISIILSILRAMRERDKAEKCLIFSQWTSMLDIIGWHVVRNGFKCCRLDGSVPMPERKTEIARFKTDKDAAVFLISMHAGGTGLNLTEASNVILADVWWNPSVEEQCCDRAHRIGQKRKVRVTRLKILGTVEDRIYEMCKRKAEMCKGALGEKGAQSLGRHKMTIEDAMALFGTDGNEGNGGMIGGAGSSVTVDLSGLG